MKLDLFNNTKLDGENRYPPVVGQRLQQFTVQNVNVHLSNTKLAFTGVVFAVVTGHVQDVAWALAQMLGVHSQHQSNRSDPLICSHPVDLSAERVAMAHKAVGLQSLDKTQTGSVQVNIHHAHTRQSNLGHARGTNTYGLGLPSVTEVGTPRLRLTPKRMYFGNLRFTPKRLWDRSGERSATDKDEHRTETVRGWDLVKTNAMPRLRLTPKHMHFGNLRPTLKRFSGIAGEWSATDKNGQRGDDEAQTCPGDSI